MFKIWRLLPGKDSIMRSTRYKSVITMQLSRLNKMEELLLLKIASKMTDKEKAK